jgi:uncharacterized protein YbaP (TraB family)
MRRALLVALTLFVAFFGGPVVSAELPLRKATPVLWVVHGPKGTAYLLGSIHALPKNIDWRTLRIDDAAKRADTFVFEVKMDDEGRTHARTIFARNGIFPLSYSLPSFFDEEMREDYRNVIAQTHADPTAIVYMRPWLAALVLQGVADGGTGFVPAEGVDNRIYADAKARGIKRFLPLETDETQLKLLMGDGNVTEELALLRATFKKILASRSDVMQGLLDAWCRGDAKALASYGPESTAMTPAARKALLEDRNRAWVPQIEAMLKQKHTYFITVGAAHLVGKTGVPNLLRADGYTVEGP